MKIILILTAALLVFTGYCKSKKKSFRERGFTSSASSASKNIGFSSRRMTQYQRISISNLKQMGMALVQYAGDNRERFPSPVARQSKRSSAPSKYSSIDVLYTQKYLRNANVYIAGFDKQSVKAAGNSFDPAKNSSYAYIGYGIICGNYGSEFPLLFEKPWLLPENWDKIAVCFADGSCRIITIPGVSKMSCRQVVEYLLRDQKQSKTQFLKNADIADRIH